MKTPSRTSERNIAFVFSQLLIAVAVLARVIIPQGFMIGENIGSDGGNRISIILCTAQGDLPATIDSNGDIRIGEDAPSDHENGDNGPNNHCTFVGALADLSVNSSKFDYKAANWDFSLIAAQYDITQIGNGLAAPPPPKTGPPIFS